MDGNGTTWASNKTAYTYYRVDTASTPLHQLSRHYRLGGRTAPTELARSLALATLGVRCDPRLLVVLDRLGEAKLGPPLADELLDFLG